VTNEYSQHEMSQVVQTSWAVLGLMYARYPDKQVIRRGCELIMSRQQAVSPAFILFSVTGS
jgi:lanosterol synthase